MFVSSPAVLPGAPGGPELIIVLSIILLLLGLLGRWIYRDAKSRGSDWAWQWATGIPMMFVLELVPGLLTLIIYLLVRDDRPAQ